MLKDKIHILICSSIVLSVSLSAAPLDKYYVPQGTPTYPQHPTYPQSSAPTVRPSVYSDFEKSIENLASSDIKNLIVKFSKERDQAAKNKNIDDFAYYQNLIDILNKHL